MNYTYTVFMFLLSPSSLIRIQTNKKKRPGEPKNDNQTHRRSGISIHNNLINVKGVLITKLFNEGYSRYEYMGYINNLGDVHALNIIIMRVVGSCKTAPVSRIFILWYIHVVVY